MAAIWRSASARNSAARCSACCLRTAVCCLSILASSSRSPLVIVDIVAPRFPGPFLPVLRQEVERGEVGQERGRDLTALEPPLDLAPRRQADANRLSGLSLGQEVPVTEGEQRVGHAFILNAWGGENQHSRV